MLRPRACPWHVLQGISVRVLVSVQLLGTARERFRTYNAEYKHGKGFEAFEPFVMFIFLHRLKIKQELRLWLFCMSLTINCAQSEKTI